MALEDLTGSGKYIDDLVSANPAVGDDVSEGDDHIRGIKNVLKLTFPSIDGAITATDTELNYVDGVTSAIQTQIDNKTTNATHSGEVTGSTALTIADNIVDEANLKVSNTPTNGYVLTAQSGNTGGLTWAADNNTVYTHPNHSGEVTSTADGATVIAGNVVDEANLKVSNAPSNGYYLQAQSGNTGGMTWAEVDALPTQTSNSGKFLTTNGSAASWAVLDTDANTTTKGLYEMANVISANYVIANNNNAMSAGPITINSNISVTVPSGSTWVIA